MENLFCSKHDNEVFERIENLRFKTDLDTYLYLYGYRFFIFEYYHENMIKKELRPKIYENKSYSKKINKDLQENLGASAHLIHGSSEGRFSITYCPGSEMSREEIEGVGFNYGDRKSTRLNSSH